MEVFWPIFLSLAYLIIGAYAIMIFYAISGWNKLKIAQETEPKLSVTILIAARNEAKNIRSLLQNLKEQSYPKELFEIIVIDDHSEDQTQTLAQEMAADLPNLRVLENQQGQGKKAALTTGISEAKFPISATIDADCHVSFDWLSSMMANWSSTTKMLLGPVVLSPTSSMLEKIQSMEMMAIMGLTGGFAAHQKPIMANGANLFFSRNAFEETGGHSQENNPSGDDVFVMLQLAEKWPNSIQFVKDFRAIVQTAPQPDLRSFWQQRKRWLSKKGGYSNSMVKLTAIISYAANAMGLVALLVSIATFGSTVSEMLIWFLFIKTVLDLIIIRKVRTDLNPICGIGSIIYAEIFILVYVTLLGIFGNVKNYTWKGRSVNVKK
ncbi:MAG: glycosyltransferase [Flavobacteriales bacterium]|nr:glycosyltransferase [Flavobacteriales bacterium]